MTDSQAASFGKVSMSDRAFQSRIRCTIDLNRPGKQVGDLMLRHSDNRQPLGFYPVPVISIANAEGPSVLLIAGVHGDEFEGPAALLRLAHDLQPDDVRGRLIILPALNFPAVEASSRVSPLDDVNLNRAFPGDPNGSPSAMLAHYVEDGLIAQCDAVIDLHSGGKASVFAACSLAADYGDDPLFEKNMELAVAFGAPLVWVLGGFNDDRSVNAAATRKNVAMIAAELGGGGGCDPALTDIAEQGVRRCLHHLGVLQNGPPAGSVPRAIEISGLEQNLYAPRRGLFDRRFSAGDEVAAGQDAGVLHFVDEPDRAPQQLEFSTAGVVLAHGNRGFVERGDMLALVAQDVQPPIGKPQ